MLRRTAAPVTVQVQPLRVPVTDHGSAIMPEMFRPGVRKNRTN